MRVVLFCTEGESDAGSFTERIVGLKVSVARPLDRKDKAAIIAGYGEDQAMKIFEGRVHNTSSG